ncbi:MAG: sulfite exporter TauE/SafE family protein [Magnetococcales bacterium]|nr:sulfite exporter TauE/SafE family protein [Magnetococcales bacterium]
MSDLGFLPAWTTVTFPVSGVVTHVWLPPLVAFVVSFFTSMVGISGAVLLLPFQVSVLHFVTPAVSATNLVFNLVAIPGGVWRYIREGRMHWPLTRIIVIGTLPGIVIGYFLRIAWLPDPASFKRFVGWVLLYLAVRLLADPGLRKTAAPPADNPECHFHKGGMLLLAGVVGVIGGIYGIGGGAIIAPFCVTLFRLPVHAIAGATLMGTFLTSVVGVLLYSLLPAPPGLPTAPDWALGALFGLGGLGGMYLGARCQKFVPQKWLKWLLGGMLTLLALHYV